MNNKKLSIRTIFILVMLAVIIITILGYTMASTITIRSTKAWLIDNQKITGLLMVDLLEEVIDKQRYILVEKFRNTNLSKSMFLGKDIRNAYLLSKNGKVKRVYKRGRGFYIYPGINIKNTNFFKDIKRLKKDSAIFPIAYSPFSNRLIRAFVMKRYNDYLVVDINLLTLSTYFSQLHRFKKSMIAISQFGDIIISKTSSKRFPYVLARENKFIKAPGREKFIMIPISSPILREKLYILTPYKTALKTFLYIENMHGWIYIILIAILILLFVWELKFIISPLSKFANALSRFSIENPISVAMIPDSKYKEFAILKDVLLKTSFRIVEDTKRLKETLIYLENLINHFPNGIIIVNPENMEIEHINHIVEKLCEKKQKNVIGHNIFEVFPLLAKHKEQISKEKIFKVRKNQSIFEIKPKYIKEGGFSRIVIQIEDITEKEKLEEKLQQVKRMETVNLLSKGFSHDFNNLLNAISGYTQLLELTNDPEKKKKTIKKIEKTVEVAEELVKKIQILSKATHVKKEVILVKEFLFSSITTTEAKEIKIDVNIDEIANEKIYGDAYLLTISMSNILQNAIDATKEKNDRSIRLYGKKIEKDSKKYIAITVEDNGKGMDEETKEKIFEPFFTNKGLGKIRGTGLGMTIVYGIVESHDGYIEIDSEEGKGTKITIYLPTIEKGEEGLS